MESGASKRQEVDPAALLSRKLLRILLVASSTLGGAKSGVDPEKYLLSGDVVSALDRTMNALRKDDPSAWPVRRLLLGKWDFIRKALVPVYEMAGRLVDELDQQRIRFAVLKVMVVLTMVPGVVRGDWFATDEWREGIATSKAAFLGPPPGGEDVLASLGGRLIGLFRSKRENAAFASTRMADSSDDEAQENADAQDSKSDREIELILTLFRNILHVVPPPQDLDLVNREQRLQRDRQLHFKVVLGLDKAGLYKVLSSIFSKPTEISSAPTGTLLLVAEIYEASFHFADGAELAQHMYKRGAGTGRAPLLRVENSIAKVAVLESTNLSQTEESLGLASALARERENRLGGSSQGGRRWGTKFNGSVLLMRDPDSAGGHVAKAQKLSIGRFEEQIKADELGVASRASLELEMTVPTRKRKRHGESRPHPKSSTKGPTMLQYKVSCTALGDEELAMTALGHAADLFIKKCYTPVLAEVRAYLEEEIRRNPLVGTSPDEEDIARDLLYFMNLAAFLTRYHRHRCVRRPSGSSLAHFCESQKPILQPSSEFAFLRSTLDAGAVKLVLDHSRRISSHRGTSPQIDKAFEAGLSYLAETLAALSDIIECHPAENMSDSHLQDTILARRGARQIYAQNDICGFNAWLLRDFDAMTHASDLLPVIIQLTRSSLFLIHDEDNVIFTTHKAKTRRRVDGETADETEMAENDEDEEEEEDPEDLKTLDLCSALRSFMNGKSIFNILRAVRHACKLAQSGRTMAYGVFNFGTGREAVEVFHWLWLAAATTKRGLMVPNFCSLSSLALYEAVMEMDRTWQENRKSGGSWLKLTHTVYQIVERALSAVQKQPCFGVDLIFSFENSTCDAYRRADDLTQKKTRFRRPSTHREELLPQVSSCLDNLKSTRNNSVASDDEDDIDNLAFPCEPERKSLSHGEATCRFNEKPSDKSEISGASTVLKGTTNVPGLSHELSDVALNHCFKGDCHRENLNEQDNALRLRSAISKDELGENFVAQPTVTRLVAEDSSANYSISQAPADQRYSTSAPRSNQEASNNSLADCGRQ